MTAKEIVSNSIIIDMHLDLLYDVVKKRANGRKNVICEDYLTSFKDGGVTCIVSTLYVDPVNDDYLIPTLQQLSAFYAELNECGGQFFLATHAEDIIRAKQEGKIAIMLSFEGVEGLVQPDFLRLFHQLGVRLIGVCWSRPNWAADGAKFNDFEYQGYGITDMGKELLATAAELSMPIDVSHMNEKGFWDIAGFNRPFFASHSNARKVSDTPRNLSDEQILAIGKNGGIVGMNGASLLVDFSNPGKADMQVFARHIRHFEQLIGADKIGLGLDQCDRFMDTFTDDPVLSQSFDLIPTHERLLEFVDAMLSEGFSESEIRGFLGGNMLRFIQENVG